MNIRTRLALAFVALTVVALTSPAEAKALIAAPARPGDQVIQADAVVLGKVTEIEKDAVDASPFPGAPKGETMSFKIAVLKVNDAILGAKGLTQIRVGFPADAMPAGDGEKPDRPVVRRPIRGLGPVALTAGQEGCFLLTRHHSGDFYVLVMNGKPLDKKDANFDKELAEVKKTAKTFDEPVAALKSKELVDRFRAANALLQRYGNVRPSQVKEGGKIPERELIPEDENRLIVKLLTELPWMPAGGEGAGGGRPRPGAAFPEAQPSRMALWGMINADEIGYKYPEVPPARAGEQAADYNKIMDESTTKFLKAKGADLKLKRFPSE